jgi:hypothetical protein
MCSKSGGYYLCGAAMGLQATESAALLFHKDQVLGRLSN